MSLDPIQSQLHPLYTVTFHNFKANFNVIVQLSAGFTNELHTVTIQVARLETGVGLAIGFIDNLYRTLETTLYNSLTHTDQCSQSITVSTSRLLSTDLTQ
jgi:hypothetical protein